MQRMKLPYFTRGGRMTRRIFFSEQLVSKNCSAMEGMQSLLTNFARKYGIRTNYLLLRNKIFIENSTPEQLWPLWRVSTHGNLAQSLLQSPYDSYALASWTCSVANFVPYTDIRHGAGVSCEEHRCLVVCVTFSICIKNLMEALHISFVKYLSRLSRNSRVG